MGFSSPLMEERRQRETQFAEEREQREREIERQRLQREAEMQEKLDMVMRLVENVGKSKSAAPSGEATVKISKLTGEDDIEGYLTTFESSLRSCKEEMALSIGPKIVWEGTASNG